MITKEERDWINNSKKRGYIYILAQPYSGAELLAGLLSELGTTVAICNDLKFLESVININETFKTCVLHKQKYEKWEEIDENGTRYCLRNILYKGCYEGAGLTTSIGWNNNLTERFVEALRSIHYNHYGGAVRIVFLTRDTNDVIKELIENQKAQFKSCFELGDMWLSYEGFMSDVKGTLIKLKPKDYPTDEKIRKVMI